MRKPCSHPGCDTPRQARGMCSKHYMQAKRRGEFSNSKCECGQPSYIGNECQYHYTNRKYREHSPAFDEAEVMCIDCFKGFTRKVRRSNRCAPCQTLYRKRYSAKWRRENKDTIALNDLAYRVAHSEERKAHRRKRRSMYLGAYAEDILWSDIVKLHGDKCHICGKSFPDNPQYGDPLYPTADHVIPLSKGGAHVLSNVMPAHASCNAQKGNNTSGWKTIQPYI